jgi:hypothetical protein
LDNTFFNLTRKQVNIKSLSSHITNRPK